MVLGRRGQRVHLIPSHDTVIEYKCCPLWLYAQDAYGDAISNWKKTGAIPWDSVDWRDMDCSYLPYDTPYVLGEQLPQNVMWKEVRTMSNDSLDEQFQSGNEPLDKLKNADLTFSDESLHTSIYPKAGGGAWLKVGDQWYEHAVSIRGGTPLEALRAYLEFCDNAIYMGVLSLHNPNRPAQQAPQQGSQPSTITPAPQLSNTPIPLPTGDYVWQMPTADWVEEKLAEGNAEIANMRKQWPKMGPQIAALAISIKVKTSKSGKPYLLFGLIDGQEALLFEDQEAAEKPNKSIFAPGFWGQDDSMQALQRTVKSLAEAGDWRSTIRVNLLVRVSEKQDTNGNPNGFWLNGILAARVKGHEVSHG